MSDTSEHLERLINRSLDGGLDADEQLELDRELIRNPGARSLLEDYQRIDRLAVCALDRAIGQGQPASAALAVTVAPRRHHRGLWWLVPGAIAAALLATVVPYPTGPRTEDRGSAPVASIGRSLRPSLDGAMHNVAQPRRTTPQLRRDTGRDVIGVMGDDGNLYWIEVERTRTVKLPPKAMRDSL